MMDSEKIREYIKAEEDLFAQASAILVQCLRSNSDRDNTFNAVALCHRIAETILRYEDELQQAELLEGIRRAEQDKEVHTPLAR